MHRTDANQRAIMDALRGVGASVVDLSAVGKSCPDILVGHRGFNWLMEIKTAGGFLSPGQRTFIAEWRGARVLEIRSVEEALTAVGAI